MGLMKKHILKYAVVGALIGAIYWPLSFLLAIAGNGGEASGPSVGFSVMFLNMYGIVMQYPPFSFIQNLNIGNANETMVLYAITGAVLGALLALAWRNKPLPWWLGTIIVILCVVALHAIGFALYFNE